MTTALSRASFGGCTICIGPRESVLAVAQFACDREGRSVYCYMDAEGFPWLAVAVGGSELVQAGQEAVHSAWDQASRWRQAQLPYLAVYLQHILRTYDVVVHSWAVSTLVGTL